MPYGRMSPGTMDVLPSTGTSTGTTIKVFVSESTKNSSSPWLLHWGYISPFTETWTVPFPEGNGAGVQNHRGRIQGGL